MKRLLSMLLVSVMVSGVTTSCSSNNTASNSGTTKAPQSGEKNQEAEGKQTEVVVWLYSFKEKAHQEEIQAGFEKLGLKNIKLTLKEIPQGTPTEVGEKLVTSIIGGEKIDIFDTNLADYFNFSLKGLYEPLNSYLKEDSFDVNSLGESNIKLSQIKEELYGLPYIKSKFVLYYNKNLFDAAGIPYPSDDMTWDEFRDTALKLTKGEGQDKIWGYTMPDWPCTWATIACQQNIRYIDPETNKVNLDNPLFKDALQFKYDLSMVDKSGPSLAENKTTKAHYGKQFSAGNVAMLISGDWTVGQIAANLENKFTFEYDITNIPHPEGVEKGTTYGSPRYIGINKKSNDESKKAAWEVMKYLSSEEVAKVMAKYALQLPAINTPEVAQVFKENVPEFVTNAQMILEDSPYVEEKPFHIASSIVEKIMIEESELALSGNKSVEDAMKDMQKRAQEEVNNLMSN